MCVWCECSNGELNLAMAEAEMMKERFAKLLLGEDLSGGGKGVSTALAVSNAITNLSGKIYVCRLFRLVLQIGFGVIKPRF